MINQVAAYIKITALALPIVVFLSIVLNDLIITTDRSGPFVNERDLTAKKMSRRPETTPLKRLLMSLRTLADRQHQAVILTRKPRAR